jgi:hypothetical protein
VLSLSESLLVGRCRSRSARVANAVDRNQRRCVGDSLASDGKRGVEVHRPLPPGVEPESGALDVEADAVSGPIQGDGRGPQSLLSASRESPVRPGARPRAAGASRAGRRTEARLDFAEVVVGQASVERDSLRWPISRLNDTTQRHPGGSATNSRTYSASSHDESGTTGRYLHADPTVRIRHEQEWCVARAATRAAAPLLGSDPACHEPSGTLVP